LHCSAVSTRLKLAVNGVVTDHLGFSFDNQMQSFRYFASLDNALRVFADFNLANHRQYYHEIWAGLVAIVASIGSKQHIQGPLGLDFGSKALLEWLKELDCNFMARKPQKMAALTEIELDRCSLQLGQFMQGRNGQGSSWLQRLQ
jgi:hypothetical protein